MIPTLFKRLSECLNKTLFKKILQMMNGSFECLNGIFNGLNGTSAIFTQNSL